MPIFDPSHLSHATAQVAQARQDNISTPSSGIGLGPYAALIGGEGADIASTLYALKHGGSESNPLLGNFGPGAIAGKAALTLPMILLMRHLASHGHEKLAKGLGYGTGAALGGVAAHNLGVANGQD